MAKVDAVEKLVRAIWQGGDESEVARLAQKADVNGADRWRQRPLLMAAAFGSAPMAAALLARGARVDQDRRYLTPLTLAVRRRDDAMVALLRAAGGTASLITAIYLGERAEVEKALAREPALVHLCDEEGTPLVQHAAMALSLTLTELVLARSAGVDEATPDGVTALHRVCDQRRADGTPTRKMVALLLARGADPNARNWAQVTPLHHAVRARNLAAVEALLACPAVDVNARDNRGSTPLRRAVSGTGASATAGTSGLMVPLTELLLARGADPDARDKRGVPVRDSARDPAVKAVLAAHPAAKPQPKKRR